jgi:type II secretory pathway component PulF
MSNLSLPSHVLAIIEAGEAGTGMGAALESAAQVLEARAAMSTAFWNALSYPILLAVAGTASIALLVGIVLPRFAELMVHAGGTLPLTTRLLLGLSDVIQAAGVFVLVIGVSLVVACRSWLKQPSGLRQWHSLVLRSPVVGPVRRSALTARACSTLAALLEAGVPLASAMPLAARSTGDSAVEAALDAARRRIVTGESFSSAIRAERALTATALHFAQIGEEVGHLGSMLGHAARVESGHALQRLKRLTRLIEPGLVLVFGAIVMAVAAALLQAIYGLRPS